MDPKLAIAGLLIGLLVGMTGMGGGSLMTPLLVFLFGFKPTVAIGTDILHGAIFKSFGAVRHRQLGTVHLRLTAWMLLGSAPFSLLGVGLSEWLEHRYGESFQDMAATLLGAALIVCGIGFCIKTFLRGRAKSDAPFLLAPRDRRIAVLLGASGGFVVGMTSVGSGTFFALVMLLAFPLTAAKVVGTDIFHAAALLWIAGAGHLVAGNVDLVAMAALLLGSVPGVLIGSSVSVKLPERALRLGLAATLTVAGLKLVEVPGSDYIVVAALAAGGLVLVAGAVREAVRRLTPAVPAPAETAREAD